MLRTICIGLMALPVYFYNVQPSLAISGDVLIVKTESAIATALMSHSINTHTSLPPWRISARDDQTGDCIRYGGCRY